MPINRERIEKRLAELKSQFEYSQQQQLAVRGAIMDLEFLLSEDTVPAAPVAPVDVVAKTTS
jgi:hypothetical protein